MTGWPYSKGEKMPVRDEQMSILGVYHWRRTSTMQTGKGGGNLGVSNSINKERTEIFPRPDRLL